MEFFLAQPTALTFLVVRDIDIDSASRLGELFIPKPPRFDAVLVCGPLGPAKASTAEELAIVHGDIATALGHLENIVCRVMYLPSERDPLALFRDQVHLTANSCSIHARNLPLTKDLFLIGYSELTGREKVEDSDLEDMEITSATSSAILKELLVPAPEGHTGILAMNYQYSHTLNQVLFHMSADLEAAGIGMCVVAHIGSGSGEETSRLPKTLGKLSLVAPKSLREGHYSEVRLQQQQDGRWTVTNNECCRLPHP